MLRTERGRQGEGGTARCNGRGRQAQGAGPSWGGSPCLRMKSTRMSITMIVPVRPMPALLGRTKEACGQLTGQSRGRFPGRTCTAGPAPSPVAPAMDYHGSGPRHAVLGPVHLVQEAKDAGGLGRDAVVRPTEVLVVLHCVRRLLLGRVGW